MTKLQAKVVAVLMCVLLGLSIALSTQSATVQYFPVAFYKTTISLPPKPSQAGSANDDGSSAASPEDSAHWRVFAEVRLLRPVARQYRGRGRPPHPPRREDVVGEERGVTLRIAAWEIDSRAVWLLWPPPERASPESGFPRTRAMPAGMLQRVLPLIAEDVRYQSRDDWLADAVAAGGVEPPPIKGRGFGRASSLSLMAAFGCLAWLLIMRWRARRESTVLGPEHERRLSSGVT